MKVLRERKGFTLLEVLIVIVILGILAGLAIPVYQGQVNRSYLQEALRAMTAYRESAMRYYADTTKGNLDYTTMTVANTGYDPNTEVGGQTNHFSYVVGDQAAAAYTIEATCTSGCSGKYKIDQAGTKVSSSGDLV